MREFTIKTQDRTDFVNIDREVMQIVRESGVKEGICCIFVPHTTAGITINENADPDVVRDMKLALERAVPWEAGYAHAEGNAAAHVKASLVGFSQQVLVEGGRLKFGTWQSLYFCEFDGPRTRRVWVEILNARSSE